MTLAEYLTLKEPRPPFRMGIKGRTVWTYAERYSCRAQGYRGVRRNVVRVKRIDKHGGLITAIREYSDIITLVEQPRITKDDIATLREGVESGDMVCIFSRERTERVLNALLTAYPPPETPDNA